MTSRSCKYILISSFINGLVMVVVTFFMLNQPMVRGDEKALIKNTTAFKQWITGKDTSMLQSFLFLNVSHDKELIPYYDKDSFPAGNEAITDRKNVSDLVAFLNKNRSSFRYFLCDIYFIGDSPNDSMLAQELIKLGDKAIIPFHFGKEKPKFRTNMALADYIATEQTFVKFKLTQYDPKTGKLVKSIPLIMSEKLNSIYSKTGGLFFQLNNKPAFNNFIINLRITKDDFEKGRCAYLNLGGFLYDSIMTDSMKLALVKDRIVVVGLLLGTPSSLLHCLSLLMLGCGLVMPRLLLLSSLLNHHALINGSDALGKVGKSDLVGLGELGGRRRPEKLQLADQLIADEGIVE